MGDFEFVNRFFDYGGAPFLAVVVLYFRLERRVLLVEERLKKVIVIAIKEVNGNG